MHYGVQCSSYDFSFPIQCLVWEIVVVLSHIIKIVWDGSAA